MAEINAVDDFSDFSDFGGDAEEVDIIEQLLSQVEVDIEDGPHVLRLPKVSGLPEDLHKSLLHHSSAKPSSKTKSSEKQVDRSESKELPPVPEDRSPLERFRKPPRKALSVTDLVSPLWCELQYYYSLVEPHRKKTTMAMKKGTAIHKALEDEVHTTVAVETISKEDAFGLKIWNMIQGLWTLRETGKTREFALWGLIGGEVVVGIIDELSYQHPVSRPEEASKLASEEPSRNQSRVTDYLKSDWNSSIQQARGGVAVEDNETEKQVYIKDVKTRLKPSLPDAASTKPTILQLHLYHQLLRDLILGNFQLSHLANRYELDVDATFSDQFIAQLATISQDFSQVSGDIQSQEQSQMSQTSSASDLLDLLLRHNNLTSLWNFMMSELQMTFIKSEDLASRSMAANLPSDTIPRQEQQLPPIRLSNLLTAEYITSLDKTSPNSPKKSIGMKHFGFNAAYLKTYLEDNLKWWHGERAAKGVRLEDAWKCRSCDFRDGCTWIQEQNKTSLQDALEKKRMRALAGVAG